MADQQAAANAWCKQNFDREGGEFTFTVPRWKKNSDPDTDPPDYYTCSIGGITPAQFAQMESEMKKAKYKADVVDDSSKSHRQHEQEKEFKAKEEKKLQK